MGEEEGSVDEEDSTMNKFYLNQTSFHFENVRFSPKVIEFLDVFEGKQSSVRFTIQNIGTKPVLIKMGKPKSFIFQMKKGTRRMKLLAAGASLSKTITYSYHNDDMVERSKIPIEINGHLVEYPIVVKKAMPEIEVEPTKLNFEIINLGALSKTMVLTIHNIGGKRTRFTIDVGKNNLKLVVKPIRGTVSAKSKAKVLVEVMGLKEGEYYSEIWITSNEMPIRVPVLVEVLRPRLEIVHSNETEDFTLIDFRPTFVGTQTVDSFLLKNRSSEPTFFVTLAEVNGDYQFLKDAKNAEETFGMFIVSAEEGRLEAFESRIVTILFKPKAIVKSKGWSHQKNEMKKKNQWEHIVFFRIKRIHGEEKSDLDQLEAISAQNMVEDKGELVLQFVEPMTTSGSSNPFEEPNPESVQVVEKCLSEPSLKPLRICLHGEAVEPDITIQPSTLEFDTLLVGETKKKVVAVTNTNKIAVKYKFGKTLNVEVTPKEGWLRSKQVLEHLVVLSPTCAGEFKRKVTFEIFAKSHVVFEKDKSLMKIGEFVIAVRYKAEAVQKTPAPKIGLGITPLVTDEVGILKEHMTFSCDFEKPYAAMLLSLTNKFKPEWMRKEVDKKRNLDKAIIAFPNDRPHEFHCWPKGKVCRTIFQGFFRYSPPQDTKYALTGKELTERQREKDFWKSYLEFLRQLRKLNRFSYSKDVPAIEGLPLDYDGHCEHNFKYVPVLHKPESELQKALIKTQQEESWGEFTPLSSMHLGQVRVRPKIINFCAVATETITYETLTVKNKNTFCISIKFVSGKPEVGVHPTGNIRVPPGATKFVKISFQRKDLGSYFGFLSYVINGSHAFKITIFALVTSKTLHLSEKDLSLEFENYLQKNAFYSRSRFLTLWNFLQFPVKYRWNLPCDSSFFVEPVEGEVPPRSKILTELVFRVDPKKPFSSELKIISESASTEIVKVSHPNKNVFVHFTTHRIDLKEVPLNLPTKVKPIIRNACYHDVAFEVTDWTPMPGVSVVPKHGILKARSFFPLDIRIKIPVVMKFSFEVVVIIHRQNRISVKIHGRVVVPLIRIRPTDIVMPRICAESFDAVTVCIENGGKTPAEVTIDFKDCPGYKIGNDQTRIYLGENKSSKVVIYFHPNDVARYVFYLPIIINNILGPPLMQERQTEFLSYYLSKLEELYRGYGRVFPTKTSNFKIPCITINSSVSPALLKISSLNVVFQLQSDSYSEFQPRVIEFSNEFVDDVTFCIRTDDLEKESESPFSLTPTRNSAVEYKAKSIKANLKQNEKLVFDAKFEPHKPGLYSVNVPIYIKGYNNGAVFNYIKLTGELKQPRLYPEYLEIHIPPLPLEVACEATISIYAENYRYSSPIHCFMYDLNEDNELGTDFLSTSWLVEPKINNDTHTQVFKLQIRFRSFVPIALRSYLVLVDCKGEYCTILVTATSDNSAITTHAFLTTRLTQCNLLRYNFLPLVPNAEDKLNVFRVPEGSFAKDHWKETKKRKSTQSLRPESGNSDVPLENNAHSLPTDQKFFQQTLTSASRLNQVNFLDGAKTSMCKSKESSSSVLLPSKMKIIHSVSFQTDSSSGVKTLSGQQRSDTLNDMTYPNFPMQDTFYGKYFQETLAYVERWVFEVVMRCDQYFSIPRNFQNLEIWSEKPSAREDKGESKNKVKDFASFLEEFFDIKIRSILGSLWKNHLNNPVEKAQFLHSFFSEVLEFLRNQGCLLPHVKPEHLLDYENYLLYRADRNWDVFKWKDSEADKIDSVRATKDSNLAVKWEKARQNSSTLTPQDSWKKSLFSELHMESVPDVPPVGDDNDVSLTLDDNHGFVEGREFVHESKVLDPTTFEVRSTQAWLDTIIQIFKSFCLNRVFLEDTIPEAKVSSEPDLRVKMSDPIIVEIVITSCVSDVDKKCIHILEECSCAPLPVLENFENNLYSEQEMALLKWLNFHLANQEDVLRSFAETKESSDLKLSPWVVNNFDVDLMDSLALVAVTTAHCPYIAHEFSDVFLVADTQNKVYHNAARLISIWRMLSLPLTVETLDIVKPNPIFMMMLVSHLYDVLPSLHPRSIICFSAPLTTEVTRTIHIKNESLQPIFYQANFFGETKGIFHLGENHTFEIKPRSTKKFKITYVARKIQKVSATLVLCGCVVSPIFARNLTFFLEGVPSTPLESKHFTFAVPLYQVVCKDIFLNPPYAEPTTYEVWYTTKEPCYREDIDVSISAQPWSEIRHMKVSRRLFINQCNVAFDEREKSVTLNVTMACLTVEDRSFWLLFRSPQVGDFIIRLLIKAKPISRSTMTINGFYSESWSPTAVCLCPDEGTNSKVFTSNWNRCPFLLELNIPARNETLWECLRVMFLKTLNTQEKSFWTKHFETNTGFCLILWLLSADEEEEVIDEFVHIFQTEVTYNLMIEHPDDKYVTIPDQISVPDVRENTKIRLPIHISNKAPPNLTMVLTMTSESGKEVRRFNVSLLPQEKEQKWTKEIDEEATFSRTVCRPFKMGNETCKGCKGQN